MPVNKSDRPVGYKNPPVNSRFRPGHSGNPSGRPRQPPSLQADLALELNQAVHVQVGGKQRQITKQRAIIKALVDAAIAGDMRAAAAVISLRAPGRSGGSPEPGSETAASPEDKHLLETFIEREVSRRTNETDGTPTENDDER